MIACICNNREVITECDRCNNHLCRECSAIVLGKKVNDEMEIIHKKCLRKRERLQ
jgi:hypothetical protein